MTVTEIGSRKTIFLKAHEWCCHAIVSTSVLVCRVNLEEEQKWRLHETLPLVPEGKPALTTLNGPTSVQ